jgi:hypothetical protein
LYRGRVLETKCSDVKLNSMKLGILFIFPFLVLLSTACENVDKNSIGNLSKNGISAPRV